MRKVAKKELKEEQESALEETEYSRFELPKTRSQARNETSYFFHFNSVQDWDWLICAPFIWKFGTSFLQLSQCNATLHFWIIFNSFQHSNSIEFTVQTNNIYFSY